MCQRRSIIGLVIRRSSLVVGDVAMDLVAACSVESIIIQNQRLNLFSALKTWNLAELKEGIIQARLANLEDLEKEFVGEILHGSQIFHMQTLIPTLKDRCTREKLYHSRFIISSAAWLR